MVAVKTVLVPGIQWISSSTPIISSKNKSRYELKPKTKAGASGRKNFDPALVAARLEWIRRYEGRSHGNIQINHNLESGISLFLSDRYLTKKELGIFLGLTKIELSSGNSIFKRNHSLRQLAFLLIADPEKITRLLLEFLEKGKPSEKELQIIASVRKKLSWMPR